MANEGISAICWNSTNWVKFKLITGIYQNFLEFLAVQELSFLAEILIDFTKIPISLHGNGTSRNLLEYLANNSENTSLILQFLNYYIITIADFRYSSGKKMNFGFLEGSTWQTSRFSAKSSYIPPPTTTTTTTAPTTTTTTTAAPTTTTTTAAPTTTTTTTLFPTTTMMPTTTVMPLSFYEVFGQLYNLS